MRVESRGIAWTVGSLLLVLSSYARPGLATELPGRRAETPAPSHPAGPLDNPAFTATAGNAGYRVPTDTAEMKRLIRERADRVSPQTRANAERRFEQAAQRVDLLAADAGDAILAARLAREFGAPAKVLAHERLVSSASWGDVVIARTLIASSRAHLEPGYLPAWRHEGLAWSQIAVGLGLSLASAVSSVDAEARVACGRERADGKVAAIYGEGARGPGPGLDTKGGSRFEAGSSGDGARMGRRPTPGR